MEMSQRIHFWYQILLKSTIFLENGKKSLFGETILGQATKKQTNKQTNNFELKMRKMLENHEKTKL